MNNSPYTPEPFAEQDFDRLAAFLDAHPFGSLISVDDGSPVISHLPFLFERDGGEHGRLIGHLARANPHWHLLASGQPVLAVFQGPHAYVSPSWYARPGGVPTWNYAVVHVHGKARLIEGREECAEILRRMSAGYESRFPTPWEFDRSDDKLSRLLEMVVGFEIEVSEFRGKFKLSQNRSAEDQQRIIEQLQRSESSIDVGTALLMAANLAESS